MSLYLGVDLGTQSVKVLIFDADARRAIARGQSALPPLSMPRPGAAEQDPKDWWTAFDTAMLQALAAEGVDRSAIAALGVSGQQHGMVAVDDAGKVLRPAKLWCDLEASAEAEAHSETMPYPVPAGFTAPKIRWFYAHEAKLAARMHRVMLPHDWLNLQLTGNFATDHGDASGSGLYDPQAGAYLSEAAALIHPDLAQKLPPILEPQAQLGTLLLQHADHFGLPHDLAVSVGSGDNMMSALGAGATEAGTWVVSLGTSGTIFGPTPEAVLDPGGNVAPFRSALGGGLPLLCTQNCSSVVEEARAASGQSHEALSAAAAVLPLSAEDPIFLPYLSGERSPNWPHASGVLYGLRMNSLQPERLYRTALEGASMALAQGMQHLVDLGLPLRTLRLVGGGANNALWARILCDLFGRPLEVVEESETAALGAAMQACWMHSDEHPRNLAPDSDGLALRPDDKQESRYQELLKRFQELGQKLFASVFLLSFLSLASCSVAADGWRYGPEVQAYPTGYIPGVQVQIPWHQQDVVVMRAAANLTNRGDDGEHDQEAGGGAGLGVGWRRYEHKGYEGWLIGARLDAWSLDIDWRDDVPGTPRRGSTDALVLQPTIEGGFSWRLGKSAWTCDLTVGLGKEINLDENGESVGDGAIALFGITLLYNG